MNLKSIQSKRLSYRQFNDNDIDDIVKGILKLVVKPPLDVKPKHKIFNIGNSNPVKLEKFISVLEDKIGKKANKVYMDMQPGDVLRTYADVSDLERDIDYKPNTSIEVGLGKFVDWYKEYYKV